MHENSYIDLLFLELILQESIYVLGKRDSRNRGRLSRGGEARGEASLRRGKHRLVGLRAQGHALSSA